MSKKITGVILGLLVFGALSFLATTLFEDSIIGDVGQVVALIFGIFAYRYSVK